MFFAVLSRPLSWSQTKIRVVSTYMSFNATVSYHPSSQGFSAVSPGYRGLIGHSDRTAAVQPPGVAWTQTGLAGDQSDAP